MKKQGFGGILFPIVFAVAITACSTEGGTVRVTINLGLDRQASTLPSSFIEHMLTIFNKLSQKAHAAPPANITGIDLTVTGPEMSKMELSFPPEATVLMLDVPAGNEREFRVAAYTPSATIGGSVLSDLEAGEVVELSIPMATIETKVIMPDFLNYRLIQIDNISGSGWRTLDSAQIGWPANTLRPFDVDFDASGRVFIANNYGFGTSGYNCVVRIDDINGGNFIQFPVGGVTDGVRSIAVDKTNNFVYYSNGASLYRANLDGTGIVSLAGISSITGIAVHSDGTLYLSQDLAVAADQIAHYNPVTQSVMSSYNTSLNTPWHVLIKDPYIYIANLNGANGSKIVRLNLDFTNRVGYGTYALNTNPGSFYGPYRFAAILNRKIYILDDSGITMYDKLIAMDDISGSNWQTFPTSGDGQSLFRFFATC